MTTTNGTAAMALTGGAGFLCAGRERHFALEDAACAGEFAAG
jgi:phosphosulfolactate phosphohydrolase-like enzyme